MPSSLAAALGFIGLVRGDRVKVLSMGESAENPAPALRGRHQLWRMLDYLESLQSNDQFTLTEAAKNFCIRNSGKGIVVLITDLMDKSGYDQAFRYLLAQNFDIYVIHLLSVEEFEPDVQGDLQLIDCEDADVAEVTITAPLLKPLQANAERLHRAGSRFLQPAGHPLFSGEKRCADRSPY